MDNTCTYCQDVIDSLTVVCLECSLFQLCLAVSISQLLSKINTFQRINNLHVLSLFDKCITKQISVQQNKVCVVSLNTSQLLTYNQI